MEVMTVREFFSVALTLVLVMDPIGNIPLFLTSTKNVKPERRQRVIARELVISLAIMVVFLFAGGRLLNLLHITQPALGVGGGLILMLIAVRMVFPSAQSLAEDVDGEPFIVPMAVPYMAGPSVLATLAIMMTQMPQDWPVLLLALTVCWLVAAIILYASGFLQRVLGNKVINALERLMGMILIVLASQMLLDGIAGFFMR